MDPCKWKKAKRVFVCSMSDLFHEEISFEVIRLIFAHMLRPAVADQWHTFLVLTKRPGRMKTFFEWLQSNERSYTIEWPLPYVWLGVTVENQDHIDRVRTLLRIPAAKRFVSVEPMLGPVDLAPYLPGSYECSYLCGFRAGHEYTPEIRCSKCGHEEFRGDKWGNDPTFEICPECGMASDDFEEICPECGEHIVQHHPDTCCLDWAICGGETGPGARPMHPDWARLVRDQCQAAGVPYFFKQWGEWGPLEGSGAKYPTPICFWNETRKESPIGWMQGYTSEKTAHMVRVGKKPAGRLLDGVEWSQLPEVK
jgi:protein gp37